METIPNIAPKNEVPEERKSAKYKNFPNAGPGVWGKEIREKHYDKLHDSIMARIKHVSERIDQYLPPYNEHYKVDQSLALQLETGFDDLAQLYLEITREGNGGYFNPIKEDGHYSYEPIIAFDEKLEEVHDLIIKAEKPLFDQQRGKVLVDSEGNVIEGAAGAGYKELSDEEKKDLHEQGVTMLKQAIEKIDDLKNILTTRSSLVS